MYEFEFVHVCCVVLCVVCVCVCIPGSSRFGCAPSVPNECESGSQCCSYTRSCLCVKSAEGACKIVGRRVVKIDWLVG